MLAPAVLGVVTAILGPGDFYRQSHAEILAAAIRLGESGAPIDPITLARQLEQDGSLERAGGKQRIHELALLVPATANVAHHARIVRRCSLERDLLNATLAQPLDLPALMAAGEALGRDQTAGGPEIHPLNLTELLAGPVPPVQWIWEGWLASGDLALVVGDPKVGKSLLALGLAAAARCGDHFLGTPCHPSRVGILDYENPLAEAHKRLKLVGLAPDDHDGLAYYHAPPVNLATANGHAQLAAIIAQQQLEIVVIDSLRRAAPGLEENDSSSVSNVLSPLRTLSATTGTTIIVIHHARKRIGDNPTDAAQMVRGSGDLVASVDTLLYLRAKEAGQFTLEHAASRRSFPHETILVRVDATPESLTFVNDGAAAYADDKVEAMLAKIVECLRDNGGPVERPVLAMKIGTSVTNSTYSRALKLGYQREMLAKSDPSHVGGPTLYAYALSQTL